MIFLPNSRFCAESARLLILEGRWNADDRIIVRQDGSSWRGCRMGRLADTKQFKTEEEG